MLSRSLCALTPASRLRPLLALQLSALALALTGGLTVALAQAPLAAAPQAGLVALAHAALEAVQPMQGWALGETESAGWLNPGADLDASVLTDGEDLAAPVADVAEFRSKDAFLAVDALFGGATAAHAAAAGGSAVLATALAQDHI
jgi:hypothetical protein